MTLSFSQQLLGKPSYFPEKIIAGLDIDDVAKMTLNDHLFYEVDPTDEAFFAGSCNPNFDHQPKVHTIREDKHGRWRAGMAIHPVINNRTPKRFQFADTMPCISTQRILILYDEDHLPSVSVASDGEEFRKMFYVTRDERQPYVLLRHNYDWMYALAINDGFDSIDHFFEYFNKDFVGKIIHWTDLKY